MRRLTNTAVLERWSEGKCGESYTGALTTDGTSLFSYTLKIGHRARSGTTIVGDFTSPGGEFKSMTTSCHVGKARGVADHIMHPAVFQILEVRP